MSRDHVRHAFERTQGNEIYLYAHDIFSVTSVMTEKHGPCLILLIRGGTEIWIKDTPKHRWLLDIASAAEQADALKGLGTQNSGTQ